MKRPDPDTRSLFRKLPDETERKKGLVAPLDDSGKNSGRDRIALRRAVREDL